VSTRMYFFNSCFVVSLTLNGVELTCNYVTCVSAYKVSSLYVYCLNINQQLFTFSVVTCHVTVRWLHGPCVGKCGLSKLPVMCACACVRACACACVRVHCDGLEKVVSSPSKCTHSPQVQNMPPNTDHISDKYL